MTKIIRPGLGRKFSRDEGFWYIFNTLKDLSGQRANIIDMINYVEQKLIFRTIEAGRGISIDIDNTGQYYHDGVTPYTKIVIRNTLQEGINIKVNDVDIGSKPAITLNFEGNVSAYEVSPGNVKIIIGTAISSLNSFTISQSGVQINTSPIQNIDFTGNGVNVVETSSGFINVNITQNNVINIQENGVDVSGSPFHTLNFIVTSGTIFGVSGVANINLLDVLGFNNLEVRSNIYTGTTITSGSVILSGFFGSLNPDPEKILIHINGLALEYDNNPLQSDFIISGNNLTLNVDNIGYPLDSGDKILFYYWYVN
ncbi:MAG: hypothetical protein QXF12_01450 [Candidatus Aenigmatarchaeota archaeon]